MSLSDSSERSASISSESSGAGVLVKLLTPGEAAAILRVTPRTLIRYAEDGRLRRVRLSSKSSRYTRDSVVALIEGDAA